MTAIQELVNYLRNIKFDKKSLSDKKSVNDHFKYISICESFIKFEKELIIFSYLAGKRIDKNYTDIEINEAKQFYEFISKKRGVSSFG